MGSHQWGLIHKTHDMHCEGRVSSGILASLLDQEQHEVPWFVKGGKVSYASFTGASSFVAQLLHFPLDTSKARSPLLLGHHLCG